MANSFFDDNQSNRSTKFRLDSFPVYYAPTKRMKPASKTFWRKHKFLTLATAVILILAAERLWHSLEYVGLASIMHWGHEILAGVLFVTAAILFVIFRQDEKRRTKQIQKLEEKLQFKTVKPAPIVKPNVIPFPIPGATKPPTAQSVHIDYWASHPPAKLFEDDLAMGELPDEFIAPDALVFSLREAEK